MKINKEIARALAVAVMISQMAYACTSDDAADATNGGEDSRGEGMDESEQGGDDESSEVPPEPSWALDSFSSVSEVHGESPEFMIHSFRLERGGVASSRFETCAGEPELASFRWRGTADGGAELLPSPGAATFKLGSSFLSRAVVRLGDSCEMVTVEVWGVSGAFLGVDGFQRGAKCLLCSNFGLDQVQTCADYEGSSPCDPS